MTSTSDRPDWIDPAIVEARPWKDDLWLGMWRLIGDDRWRVGVMDEWSVLEFL